MALALVIISGQSTVQSGVLVGFLLSEDSNKNKKVVQLVAHGNSLRTGSYPWYTTRTGQLLGHDPTAQGSSIETVWDMHPVESAGYRI